MRNHIYHCEHLVIGSELDALVYAYKNNLPLIQNTLNPPLIFEQNKLNKWNRYTICLSLAGKLPITKEIESIRIDEDLLTIGLHRGRPIKYKFEQLTIFDDQNISGIVLGKKQNKKKIIDWFDVKSGMNHKINKIETESDFVKEITFYPTVRLSGFHENKKDLVAISIFDEKQLHDVEYSDSYVRLKVMNLMKQNGIQGNSHGKNKRHPIRIEHSRREIRNLKQDVYVLTPEVLFSVAREELSLANFSSDSYLLKVSNYFLGDIQDVSHTK